MNGQEEEQPRVRRDHPLVQWFRRLQTAKYRSSEEELAVLKKCRDRMTKYRVEGAVVAGGVAWTVAHHLKSTFLNKLVITAATASVGAMLAHFFGLAPCLEDILALDGSQFQKELVAVLQKQRSFAPPLKKIIEKYFYLEPVYDDSNQGAPLMRLRRRLISGEDQLGFGTWDTKKQQLETRVQKDGCLQDKMSEESMTFMDPLDMLSLTNSEAAPTLENGVKKVQKKWKSQMTATERREYNRMRYLEWKQKMEVQREECLLS